MHFAEGRIRVSNGPAWLSNPNAIYNEPVEHLTVCGGVRLSVFCLCVLLSSNNTEILPFLGKENFQEGFHLFLITCGVGFSWQKRFTEA